MRSTIKLSIAAQRNKLYTNEFDDYKELVGQSRSPIVWLSIVWRSSRSVSSIPVQKHSNDALTNRLLTNHGLTALGIIKAPRTHVPIFHKRLVLTAFPHNSPHNYLLTFALIA